MNEASRWRRDLGDEISALYAERAGVRAVLLGGSAARGEADEWSDLDLIVLWDAPDVPFLDGKPLAGLGARRFVYAPTDGAGSRLEQYFLGALKIDVASVAHSTLERVVGDVLERGDLDAGKHKTLATFADCVALRGAEQLERLQARLSDYPDELAHAVVAQHLRFMPIWAPREMCLGRGDLLGFYDYAVAAIKNLLGALAALNRRFFAADSEQKGTVALLDRLELVPARARARIRRALAEPSPDTLDDLYALIEEVLVLIEAHLPGVDTKSSRAVLGIELRACPERPG
jgi:hypothetical protein